MRRQLVPAVLSMVVFTLLLGVGYSLVITGVAQLGFKDKADGSLVQRNGRDIGSSLIGQAFVDTNGEPITKYFQSRPSAAIGADGKTEAGYDPTLSSGSNLGPTNPKLLKEVAKRADAYRELNGLGVNARIPVDAVTASASGLDPDISIANARLQTRRVADERDLPVARVRGLVDEHTSGRTLGVLGEKTVNVLDLNLALDRVSASQN
jgi:K+-transporting ATPase ATPase C chain